MKLKPNKIWNKHICPVINVIGDIVFFIIRLVHYIVMVSIPFFYTIGVGTMIFLLMRWFA